ncbi:TetR family transcriptional regulator [Stackebrandtia albiflava]|uniref:TetR family transcriptional regulator n=1 Tax=Stackebrandtia albiflava TaxID=406432 RepID=A0A562VCL9_9ACTN|nr:TetR/AcrR family transcriptional regulator [Stackebrandtia albiflava]TWJ15605.1 TetR family transcriptional regulator [Stackebrandtia albiflava]
MRARNSSTERSVTELARRAQIVAAAIEVIAEEGYTKASFGRIAARAGLSSTGLISYHFAGKQDLMDAVCEAILREFADFVRERPDDGTPAGQLRTFLIANADYMAAHRGQMVTLLRIRRAQVRPDAVNARGRTDRRDLAALLAEGRRTGDFGEFTPDLMAGFILSLRDGLIERLAEEPGFDVEAAASELVAAVAAMTDNGGKT